MIEAIVHPSAVIEGDVVLGEGVQIWHFAHVRRDAVMGDRTRIGKSSFVDETVHIGRDCGI